MDKPTDQTGIRTTAASLILLLAVLVGCVSATRSQTQPGASPGVVETHVPADSTKPVATPIVTDLVEPLKLAQEHLAVHLDIPLDSIEVVQVQEVIWPDTCLGLPSPELCALRKTPGFQITLEALGKEYTYHTDRNGTIRYADPGDIPQRPN